MTSYANMFKWFINKLPGKRIFIFDLDRTLWNFTVEWRPYMRGNDALWRRPKDGPPILQFLQEKGHELNIASRSSDPDRCKELIQELYPGISFSSTQIYPTPLNKRSHIETILAGRRCGIAENLIYSLTGISWLSVVPDFCNDVSDLIHHLQGNDKVRPRFF